MLMFVIQGTVLKLYKIAKLQANLKGQSQRFAFHVWCNRMYMFIASHTPPQNQNLYFLLRLSVTCGLDSKFGELN